MLNSHVNIFPEDMKMTGGKVMLDCTLKNQVLRSRRKVGKTKNTYKTQLNFSEVSNNPVLLRYFKKDLG